MRSSFDVLASELSTTIRSLSSQSGTVSLVSDFAPSFFSAVSSRYPQVFPSSQPVFPESLAYRIQGIEEEVFAPLNGVDVFGLPRGIQPERLVRVNNEVQRDFEGKPMRERVATPAGSIFIRSKFPVDIPYRYKYLVEQGFTFAEMWASAPDEYRYMYAVPRDNVFSRSLVALVLASKRPSKFYKAFQYRSWSLGTLTLAVIPYDPFREYFQTVILSVKSSIDFSVEMDTTVTALQVLRIIPPLQPLVDVNGSSLVAKELEPTVEGFVPVDPSALTTSGTLEDIEDSFDSDVSGEDVDSLLSSLSNPAPDVDSDGVVFSGAHQPASDTSTQSSPFGFRL